MQFAFRIGLVVTAVVMLSETAWAQDSLQRLKDLYAAAAYEDALSVVTRLDASEPNPQVDQYRVFCLIALGRPAEAERAVEAVIKASPRYRPDSADASPRIQDLFSKVRGRLGPSIVKSMYIEAKASLERKDRETAIAEFEEMLRLADDPDVKDEPTISELRLLGAGFLDLSRALPKPEPPPPAAPAPQPAPPTVSRPVVTPPVAIREVLPAWIPTDANSRFNEFRGAVRVQIDAQGKVVAAEMMAPVHPVYDRLVLDAAREWTYQPARANGAPVPSEKIVQIVLKPR
jgi:tetratricopeptide (TPR) repeat protein